jgi:hypothetical protein
MARYRGTTTERGLGYKHMADRKRLLELHCDGDPCWRCGQPMYKSQELDRDHVVDRVLGGTDGPAVLAHASCNRSAGARLSNQVRPQRTMDSSLQERDTICATCGKRYWYAARTCEICGGHYHPYHSAQRACSRACGVAVTRRNKIAKGWVPPEQRPRPPCAECGKPCDAASKFCSKACRGAAARQTWPVSKVYYWTCRYCGRLGVAKVTSGQPREVCPARECQLARLAANNLRLRKGMTREQADAAVTGYRAEGDHRQLRSGRWQPPHRPVGRRPGKPAVGYAQARLW